MGFLASQWSAVGGSKPMRYPVSQTKLRARKMVQWLKVLAAKPNDLRASMVRGRRKGKK